jgi:hypothetical protein
VSFHSIVISSLVGSATFAGASITFLPHDQSAEKRSWAFQAGVALITNNTINDIIHGRIDVDDGPAGGEVYAFTASKRLGELRIELGDHVFTPQLEIPLTLEIVDERSRRPFLDYNAAFAVRWIDFPWNNLVSTQFAMGIGLYFSERIWQMDRVGREERYRSRLKFDWPISLTLAHPHHPEHQLLLFILHQSGGHFFDRAGVS